MGCGCGTRERNYQQAQLLSHAEDKGEVRRGVTRRKGRCERTDSAALASTLRSTSVDERLDTDVGDEGSDDVTHAASQGCLPSPYPTPNGERNCNTTPKRWLLSDTTSTGKSGETGSHAMCLLDSVKGVYRQAGGCRGAVG